MTTKIRVLHIVTSLGYGGIETWMRNIVRLKDKRVQNDFLLLHNIVSEYQKHVEACGSSVFFVPEKENFPRFVKRYYVMKYTKRFLKERRYDVVHVHTYGIGGAILKSVALNNISVRVVHSHSTVVHYGQSIATRMAIFLLSIINRHYILKYATDIIACSNDAGLSLVGKTTWKNDSRCKVMYCGINTAEFQDAASNSKYSMKEKYGIPKDAVVVGHVGRMSDYAKNHLFILDICKILSTKKIQYYFLLAGNGTRYDIIKQYAQSLGISDRVHMPGICDIPKLMVNCFDVFILPSIYEGLPVVGLEACAAGLFTLCSDTITRDFTESVLHDRIEAVSLTKSPKYWADRVEEAVTKRISPSEGIERIRKSPFSIEASAESLYRLYSERLSEKHEK